MVQKSNASLNKHISSNASVLKKDRSLTSNQKIPEEEKQPFDVQFKMYCTQFNSWTVPDVKIVPHEPSPGKFPDLPSLTFENDIKATESLKETQKLQNQISQSPPVVFAIFENCEAQTGLQMVVFKNFLVDRSMLIALRKSISNFSTMTILKLEHCKLKNTDLRTLKTVLQKNETVTDLSINGNPNLFQNFYILLKDTHLKMVSMRLCQINNRGVGLIATQLTTSFEQPIILLDLSSNFISDEGVDPLATALRINRNLLFLNLADNWLTDTGCGTLMEVLQTFTLRHEEIVIRRHRIMEFLKKRAEMIEYYKLKFLQKPSDVLSQKSNSISGSLGRKGGTSGKFAKDSVSRSSRGNHQKHSTNFAYIH